MNKKIDSYRYYIGIPFLDDTNISFVFWNNINLERTTNIMKTGMILIFLLFLEIMSGAYAEEQNPALDHSMDHNICLSSDENDPASALEEFINTEDYSSRLEIFLKNNTDPVKMAVCLLNNTDELSGKQVLYFLEDMKTENDISTQNYIAILSNVIKNPVLLIQKHSLVDVVFNQISVYISPDTDQIYEEDVEDVEELLTNESIHTDFQIFFLKKYLEQEICKPSVIVSVLRAVNNQDLNIYKRSEILELSFTACQKNDEFKDEFKHAMSLLAVEPELEWSLKEKVLIYHQKNSVVCCSDSDPVVEHLIESFSQEINWHIREAIVDILSESPQGCARKVISFFSEFVMQDLAQISTPTELVDFRQRKIQLILWSLVRIGMKYEHPFVVSELKKMAMKYNMNVYFRVRAVEALQDLSLYFDIAAQALYEIVRDNKRTHESEDDFITYDQTIRDENDTKIRDQAFLVLVELLEENYSDFFSFLSKTSNLEQQIYRSKVFQDQSLPDSLDLYARPALVTLAQDTKVEQKYRDKAQEILQQ